MDKNFMNQVKNQIKEYLPKNFEDAEVGIEETIKNNDCIKQGLMVYRKGEYITPKIYLEGYEKQEIIKYSATLGALGVNVAHSGTMVGVLFAPDESMKHVMEAVEKIREKFPELEYFETERLISGGYDIEQR